MLTIRLLVLVLEIRRRRLAFLDQNKLRRTISSFILESEFGDTAYTCNNAISCYAVDVLLKFCFFYFINFADILTTNQSDAGITACAEIRVLVCTNDDLNLLVV